MKKIQILVIYIFTFALLSSCSDNEDNLANPQLPMSETSNIYDNKSICIIDPEEVWSLKYEPAFDVDIRGVKAWKNDAFMPFESYIYEEYYLINISSSLIELNPAIANEFTIQNFEVRLAINSKNVSNFSSSFDMRNPAFFNNEKFYLVNNCHSRFFYGQFYSNYPRVMNNCLARLSFELKNQSGKVYTYEKYVNANLNNFSYLGYTNVYLDKGLGGSDGPTPLL